MNYKQMIRKAGEAGISPFELTYKRSRTFTMSVFHREIEKCGVSDQSSIHARGEYGGRMAGASTERVDAGAADYLIDNIRRGATAIEKEEAPGIFRGSPKYCRKNVYSKALDAFGPDEKKAAMMAAEEAAYAADSRVNEVEVNYEEAAEEQIKMNSYGLSLKSRSNYYFMIVSVVCKDGEETKYDYEYILDTDPAKLDPVALAQRAVEKTVSRFNGVSVPAGSYKCVLAPSVTQAFLSAMVNAGFSAENIQKKSSTLVGKLGEKVFSDKVSIYEKPLTRNCFYRYFDDEGVACEDKCLVKGGVIHTWLYNLETAAKDGVSSTGNGYGDENIGIRAVNLCLKSGRCHEESLFAKVGEGVYITSVTGLHAGLNPQSGDFSLEAQGFLIRDGKIASALGLFTCAGNIYRLFADVKAVADNAKTGMNGVTAGSVQVKSLKISCL